VAGAYGRRAAAGYREETHVRGAGRVVFAAILLLLVGTLNIIYGIGAISDANFYANDTRYIFTNLHAMGWFLVIVGVIQLTGGFSLMAGNPWGRLIGIIAGSLGAIDALLSMGQTHPFWNLAIFALCVWVVYGIVVYGEEERAAAP
jgi:tetrahydromethanopterin S-methyltransferase subunit C